VVESWGTGLKSTVGCGAVNLGDSTATGHNEFLGVMNPDASYNVYNGCSTGMNAQYNWWLTTDTSTIDRYLYDEEDDDALGKIDYADYLLMPRTYSVSGRITDTTGEGVDRVHVVARNSAYAYHPAQDDRIALSDTNGDFTVYGLVNGTYEITLEKQGYSFTPGSITLVVNGSDLNGQDYVATLAPPTVYGIRREDGVVNAPYGNHWAYRPIGAEVLITGLNFRTGATVALVGPLPATTATTIGVTEVASTSISATVQAGLSLGDYGVRVTNPDTQSDTWGDDVLNPAFTIINPPPPIV
jgi:hypothetical protein